MNISPTSISRSVAITLFFAVIAGVWDVWWHGSLGRESFFAPPHILLYLSVTAAILIGIYGWHRTREKIWKRLAILLALVPLSAPFDEIWHRTFEIETASSPLIVWSPPHVALILSIAGSFVMLLPILKREKEESTRNLFGALCFAAIFSLLFFLASPLEPLGPYRLVGFGGAGFASAIFAGTLLSVKKWMPGVGTGMLFIAFVCLLLSIGQGEQTVPALEIAPHAHPPNWLQMFALILPALVVDLFFKMPMWLKGALTGLLYSGVLYLFAREFIEPAFQYGTASILVAVISGVGGGIIASIFISRLSKKLQPA